MIYDKDIREPLFDFLEETFGKIRIIEEKTMGKSRADVVMVTSEALYGIEIKSDADTYTRLSTQVRDYDKYFDFNFVVVGTSHAMHIEEHVPEYWGIITTEIVDEVFDFYILRHPKANPKVKWKIKLELLWRPELARIQEQNAMPKYKEESKAFVISKLCERLDAGKINEKELRIQLSNQLFERDYNTVEEELANYRKGEIAKQIEKESDPSKKLEMMMKRAELKANLSKLKTAGRRHKRRK